MGKGNIVNETSATSIEGIVLNNFTLAQDKTQYKNIIGYLINDGSSYLADWKKRVLSATTTSSTTTGTTSTSGTTSTFGTGSTTGTTSTFSSTNSIAPVEVAPIPVSSTTTEPNVAITPVSTQPIIANSTVH